MTKYELRKYRFICQEIEQLEEQIKSLRLMILSPKNQIITGMPTGKGGNGDKIGDALCKIERLEARYNKKIEQLLREREKIECVIETLDCRERLLIRHKYIDGLTWEETATKLNYSLDNTYKLHRTILHKIQKNT